MHSSPVRPQTIAAYLSRSLPWTALSLLFLADALSLRLVSPAPWPLLILAPALFFPPGSASRSIPAFLIRFSPIIIPALAGAAEAAGFMDGRPVRPWEFAYLIAATAAALMSLRFGRERDAALAEALRRREERERSLSNLRDAEVEIAARIQRALLLDPPGQSTRELALEAITVASNAVDGDFYGFIPFSPSKVDILVGDVMGKGVPAALVGAALKSAFLRSTLRLIVAEPDRLPKPADLVSAVHQGVVKELMSLDSFATFQYARVDAAALRIDFVDCGHASFLHYDASLRLCWSLRGTNLPIGFTENPDYHAYAVPLAPGDRLLFYSDGVSEASNEKGELFGEGRLAGIVTANAYLEPREMVRRILNTAMFFASSQGFRDDVTCVAVAVNPDIATPSRVGRDFTCEEASLAGLRSFLSQNLPDLERDARDRIGAAAEDAAAAIIRLVPRGSEYASAEPERGGGDLSEPVEAVEADGSGADDGGGKDALPDLRVYRAEIIRLPSSLALRFLYRGPAMPWPRGSLPSLCGDHPYAAVSFGSNGPDLHLISLVFG